MRRTLLITVVAALALPVTGQEKLTRETLGSLKLRGEGKIVVRNAPNGIEAVELGSRLERVLVRVRTSKIKRRSFGPQLFDSSGRLSSAVPDDIARQIYSSAKKHGIDPRLVASVAYRESSFRPHLVSTAGACGVMQLMPATAEELGVDDIFDIEQNIDGGVRYLKMLIEAFDGDLDLVLAGYNAGPGAVERYQGIPPYRETINYVRNVRSDYEKALRNKA